MCVYVMKINYVVTQIQINASNNGSNRTDQPVIDMNYHLFKQNIRVCLTTINGYERIKGVRCGSQKSIIVTFDRITGCFLTECDSKTTLLKAIIIRNYLPSININSRNLTSAVTKLLLGVTN